MTPGLVERPLIGAHLRSSVNHLGDHLGGRRSLGVAAASILLALAGYGAFTFVSLDRLLGPVLDDPAAAGRIVAMLPVLLAVPAFAVSLVVAMVMPVSSPLALHARIVGVSRWRCGAAEFLPFAVVTAGLGALSQAGSIAYLAVLSPVPVLAALGLGFLDAAFALLCPVGVLVVQRIASLARLPGYESRWFAMIAATAVAGAALVDLVRWAGDPSPGAAASSVLGRTAVLWGGGAPDGPLAVGGLALVALALVIVGSALAAADPAGGYLAGGRPVLRLPALRGRAAQVVATEVAQWLRDPTARVSLACTVVGDAALVVGVRGGVVDPGIGLTVLVLLSASGAELVVGRTNPVTWLHLVAGRSAPGILLARLAPVVVVMLGTLAVAATASGAAAGSGLLLGEAVALGAGVLSVAALAGALVPFDPRAPLAMVGTTVVAFVLEIALLVVETAVLRLTGPSLTLANLAVAAVSVPVLCALHGRSGRRL
ncbi:hypothetical protein AS850_02080 [Frondihabitans sp. 762G35]|uniref:hypothetical protein n=1 Tax=Frondihabitans sp. 762G35 TaxID=1446794 RepID=UPI000D211703|nr:hypothetical protein [Frondihabitans sp. 762G35]ARC55867.1 hypothetical protein AS850_02080 [Frondihabitans sp. 762G35]